MSDIVEITPGHPAWPKSFVGIDFSGDAPKRLWVCGDLAALSRPAVAVVGSRASTSYGEQTAAKIAESAVARGHTVVSGLAYGIDAAAHRATLAAGGVTVAYLAGGLDEVSPAAHRGLAESIVASGGALVSEYAPGEHPRHERFLERNRLIAGHAQSLIVVEAGERSGSTNAARNAVKYGRRVYAVPGPITAASSRGCNAMIAAGWAQLLTDPEGWH